MIAKLQKTLVVLVVAMAIPMFFSACTKKAGFPNCKKDADCRVDAKGHPQKGVCHMGKCEECVENSDCSDLKQCINNRCETTCYVDADCGPGKHCEDNICLLDCTKDVKCPGNRTCRKGRCLSELKLGDDPNALGMEGCEGVEKIHFDFDRFEVTPQAREHLQKLAKCLQNNPGFTLLIEGHADERGTPAYNMVLGNKRAMSVKDYLEMEAGIASSRIKTVSYGSQKPASEEKNEQAWYQNRRDEFKIDTGR